MTISRGKRVLGFIINVITLNGLFIGNPILLLTSGRTVGGIVAGYKFEKAGVEIILLWIMKILVGVLYVITFGIFWIIDIVTMGNRNGTFAESWANNRKIN